MFKIQTRRGEYSLNKYYTDFTVDFMHQLSNYAWEKYLSLASLTKEICVLPGMKKKRENHLYNIYWLHVPSKHTSGTLSRRISIYNIHVYPQIRKFEVNRHSSPCHWLGTEGVWLCQYL